MRVLNLKVTSFYIQTIIQIFMTTGQHNLLNLKRVIEFKESMGIC
ncbi:hypothetical protein GM3708_2958 [Geminocystis sp. NIES-3708]|nr:hypothetical protein GM3708_2958 [Geminocystis sp. NIES-3708]